MNNSWGRVFVINELSMKKLKFSLCAHLVWNMAETLYLIIGLYKQIPGCPVCLVSVELDVSTDVCVFGIWTILQQSCSSVRTLTRDAHFFLAASCVVQIDISGSAMVTDDWQIDREGSCHSCNHFLMSSSVILFDILNCTCIYAVCQPLLQTLQLFAVLFDLFYLAHGCPNSHSWAVQFNKAILFK